MIQASKAGDWSQDGDAVVVGGTPLQPGEFDLVLEAGDENHAVSFLSGGGFVLVDTLTTPELESEGLANDLVRAINQARKARDLDVSDRIRCRPSPLTARSRPPSTRSAATSPTRSLRWSC